MGPPGREADKATRVTVNSYRETADPAIAATLRGVDDEAPLERGEGRVAVPGDGPLLGHLFESLVAQNVLRIRTGGGSHGQALSNDGRAPGIDLIVERPDGRVVAPELKLEKANTNRDVRHLLWLRERLGEDLMDAAVLTTGSAAYRRANELPLSRRHSWGHRLRRSGRGHRVLMLAKVAYYRLGFSDGPPAGGCVAVLDRRPSGRRSGQLDSWRCPVTIFSPGEGGAGHFDLPSDEDAGAGGGGVVGRTAVPIG